MRRMTILLLGFGLASCSDSRDADQTSRSEVSATKTESPATALLSAADLLRVCRGGASFRNGTKVSKIKARKITENLAQVSYTRDDGKFFRYDCMTQGNEVKFRMLDEAGPGTGPGIWSGRGSKTTFELLPGEIDFTDDFFDGSTDQETINI